MRAARIDDTRPAVKGGMIRAEPASGFAGFRRRTGLILLAVLLPAAVAAGDDARIVAVGDVHGAYDGLVEILQETGLVDEELHWIGGDTRLVQLGDLLDREAGARPVMDLLMRLQKEAREAGGRVEVLLGNHEAKNLLGLLDDVHPDALRDLAGDVDEEDQPAAYRRALNPESTYGQWLRSLPAVIDMDGTLLAHAGVSPDLLGQSVAEINRRVSAEIAVLDEIRAALHEEGLAPPQASFEQLLGLLLRERARVSEAQAADAQADPQSLWIVERLQPLAGWREWLLMARHGPLWWRGAARSPEAQVGGLSQVLEELGARRMVVAHTPQDGGDIAVRLDGRLFLVDTAMYAAAKSYGRPSALVITGELVTAVYPGERQVLVGEAESTAAGVSNEDTSDEDISDEDVSDEDEDTGGNAGGGVEDTWRYRFLDASGEPLPFSTYEEITEFLRTAAVVSEEVTCRGITKPLKLLLEKDGVRAHAVFRHVDKCKTGRAKANHKLYLDARDSFRYELAAYELSRLLGLDRVPPVVKRKHGHMEGSLQLWLEQTITESTRRALQLEPPDLQRWQAQWQQLTLFDSLVANRDRNLGNTLIDSSWTLWYIDHTRAFVTSASPLFKGRVLRCERNLWQVLRDQDHKTVRERLAPHLTPFEIDALLQRWTTLVKHLEKQIAQRGERSILYDLPEHSHGPAPWQ